MNEAAFTKLQRDAAEKGVRVFLERKTDTVYLITENGAWKVYEAPGAGLLLYHRNDYFPVLTEKQVVLGSFHRQCDVPAGRSLRQIVDYVEKHDRAKRIIAEDYRKLPQRTKRERKYYRKAERRAQRDSIRRVCELIDRIGQEDRIKKAVDTVYSCILSEFGAAG